MQIEFVKMEGIGNDFVMMDDMDGRIEAMGYGEVAKRLCDRRFGVGADGIIVALPSESCDIGFRIINSDGSEPEMCGNGMRCFAAFVNMMGLLKKRQFTVETKAGTIVPEIVDELNDGVVRVRVDMGEPILTPAQIPVALEGERVVDHVVEACGQEFAITCVSMGNPHAVIVVDELTGEEPLTYGPTLETHALFPAKTNVEFVKIHSDREVTMHVWERGAGETLACGTGACATAVACHLLGHTGRDVLIHLKGGDLELSWREEDNHLFKTGPARVVFEGKVAI